MHVRCIHLSIYMVGTKITMSDAAYRILKAQKKESESFSDVILRAFPQGNPARILAVLDDLPILNYVVAGRIRKASEDIRRNFKAQVPESTFRKGAGAKD